MQDVRELVAEDGETDDEDDREDHYAHEIVDEILVSLHAPRTRDRTPASLPRMGETRQP